MCVCPVGGPQLPPVSGPVYRYDERTSFQRPHSTAQRDVSGPAPLPALLRQTGDI